MSFLKCNYEKHRNSEILSVCIEKNCPQKRWACLGCEFQFHVNHELLNIQQLKEFIRQKNESFNIVRNYLDNLLKHVKSLDQYLKNITLLNEEHLEKLSLNQLDQLLNQLLIFSQTEPQLIPIIDLVKPLISFIEKNIKSFEKNLTQNKSVSLTIDNHTIDFQPQTQQGQRPAHRQNKIQNISFLEIPTTKNQSFHQTNDLNLKNLRFISSFQNQEMRICVNQKQANGIGLVHCQPVLKFDSQVQYSFILLSGYKLGIGIGSMPILVQDSFKPNFQH